MRTIYTFEVYQESVINSIFIILMPGDCLHSDQETDTTKCIYDLTLTNRSKDGDEFHLYVQNPTENLSLSFDYKIVNNENGKMTVTQIVPEPIKKSAHQNYEEFIFLRLLFGKNFYLSANKYFSYTLAVPCYRVTEHQSITQSGSATKSAYKR